MKLRTLISTLAIFAPATVPISLPPGAQADVYQGSVQFSAPDQPPSLTPEPAITEQAPYYSNFGVSYDDASGTVTVKFSFFEPSYWAMQRSYGQSIDFAVGTACTDNYSLESSTVPSLFGRTGTLESVGADPSAAEGQVTLRGYDGAVMNWETFDGSTYATIFQNPNLAHRGWTCAGMDANPYLDPPVEPSTTVTLTDTTPKPPAFVLTRKNASAAFGRLIPPDAAVPRTEGAYCPEVYHDSGTYSLCFAEYRQGKRWHLLAGRVQIRANAPVPTASAPTSWTRRWTRCSFKGWGPVRGTLVSNDNCGRGKPQSDAYFTAIQIVPEIRLHMPVRSVGWAFVQSAGFSSLGRYRVTRPGSTYVMTNAVGDSFSYTPMMRG